MGAYHDPYAAMCGYESYLSVFLTGGEVHVEIRCEDLQYIVADDMIGREEWGFIELAVTADEGKSTVQLFRDSCLVSSISVDKLLLDSSSILKFFGGIRQGYSVHNAFRGYIAEITIGNTPFTDRDQFNIHTTGGCLNGNCAYCSNSWAQTCRPTCAMNEIPVSENSHWSCNLCGDGGNCNSCLGVCFPCSGAEADWCSEGR